MNNETEPSVVELTEEDPVAERNNMGQELDVISEDEAMKYNEMLAQKMVDEMEKNPTPENPIFDSSNKHM